MPNEKRPMISPWGQNQPGYLTRLGPGLRSAFNEWRLANNVPYDPSPYADYDMPGFFKGLMTGDPHAQSGVSSVDGQIHYSDYWKTPYHQSFSSESQYALPGAPQWNQYNQLIDKYGQTVYDENLPNHIQNKNGMPDIWAPYRNKKTHR